MITPSDSPSSPGDYAAVAVQPMNIQAPLMDGEISSAAGGATSAASARQAEARTLLESPQGFATGGYDIDAGYHGDGGESWPANIKPGA